MTWKPVRKVLAQIWVAIAGNAGIAAGIAGTGHTDYTMLWQTTVASVLLVLAGYFTSEGTPTAPAPAQTTGMGAKWAAAPVATDVATLPFVPSETSAEPSLPNVTGTVTPDPPSGPAA